MDLPEIQKQLDDGFTVAKVQIWLTKPHEKISNDEVGKVGCKTVAEYVNKLEAEGRKSMGKKKNATYDNLPLCTVGRFSNGVKTILWAGNEIPDNLSISFE